MFPTVGNIAAGRDNFLEIELKDQERRAIRRLLAERKALLIENPEDTTQPDAERRAALTELLVIVSILGKLRLRDVTSTGAANVLRRRRSTRRSDTVNSN